VHRGSFCTSYSAFFPAVEVAQLVEGYMRGEAGWRFLTYCARRARVATVLWSWHTRKTFPSGSKEGREFRGSRLSGIPFIVVKVSRRGSCQSGPLSASARVSPSHVGPPSLPNLRVEVD